MTDTLNPLVTRALNEAGAAGVPLPAAVVAALAAAGTVQRIMNEPDPAPPALPGVFDDPEAAIAGYADAVRVHREATADALCRRDAAAALQAAFDARIASVVSAAAPEMTAAVVEAFNREWTASAAAGVAIVHDPRRLHRLNALLEARLAVGALSGEVEHPRYPFLPALVVFDLAGAPQSSTVTPTRLSHWCTAGPRERWHVALPPWPVKMVAPEGVPARLDALASATNRPAETHRQSPRMGASYDRPIPTPVKV